MLICLDGSAMAGPIPPGQGTLGIGGAASAEREGRARHGQDSTETSIAEMRDGIPDAAGYNDTPKGNSVH